MTERRERLALGLSVLTDCKTAKIRAILEEMRRDHPDMQDRVDKPTDEHATASDVQALIDAVEARSQAGEDEPDRAA